MIFILNILQTAAAKNLTFRYVVHLHVVHDIVMNGHILQRTYACFRKDKNNPDSNCFLHNRTFKAMPFFVKFITYELPVNMSVTSQKQIWIVWQYIVCVWWIPQILVELVEVFAQRLTFLLFNDLTDILPDLGLSWSNCPREEEEEMLLCQSVTLDCWSWGQLNLSDQAFIHWTKYWWPLAKYQWYKINPEVNLLKILSLSQ